METIGKSILLRVWPHDTTNQDLFFVDALDLTPEQLKEKYKSQEAYKDLVFEFVPHPIFPGIFNVNVGSMRWGIYFAPECKLRTVRTFISHVIRTGIFKVLANSIEQVENPEICAILLQISTP